VFFLFHSRALFLRVTIYHFLVKNVLISLDIIRQIINILSNVTTKEDSPIANKPYILSLTENNVRTGFFSHEEHLVVQPVVTFWYYTGWRITKILTLQWRHVNLDTAEVRLDPAQQRAVKDE